MPVAGPTLGEAVRQMLEQRGVAFHPSHKLTAIKGDSRELLFDGKAPINYDLVVAIPPHRPPVLVREAGLSNEAGWIPVDRQTLATPHERVFAIGDVTSVQIPGRWMPDVPLMLPKAGVFAHAQALVVAQRIAAVSEAPQQRQRSTVTGSACWRPGQMRPASRSETSSTNRLPTCT
jgi:sulfide:quinone oxidoreductase